MAQLDDVCPSTTRRKNIVEKQLMSSSASKSDMLEHFSLALESSEDEDAPDEITFEDSKASALRSMKDALETRKREKEQLKDRRRQRNELFLEQKKRRLLPDDVLDEIDAGPAQTQKQSEDQAEGELDDEESDGGEDDEGVESDEEDYKHKSGKIRKLEDGYTVMTLSEGSTLAASQQKAAMDFLQARLYGPGSCRTTNNELLSLENKRGTCKKAAVEFVKKGWAPKDKAKAERLKKRWLRKHQVISS